MKRYVFQLIVLSSIAFSFQLYSATEIARRCDDFIESIGMNTHLHDSRQYYERNTFGDLGVRHFRDNSPPNIFSRGYTRLNDLYSAYGIRCIMVCDTTEYSVVQRQDVMKNAVYESIEGLNEPDAFGPRSYFSYIDNWIAPSYSATIEYQKDIYNIMKSDPVTASKPVLSPAMAVTGRTRALRGSPFDAVSLHCYDRGGMPTTHRLEASIVPAALLINPVPKTAPSLILTETGWRSPASGPNTVSDLAASKYVARVLAECFKMGIEKTYIFELADTPGVYGFGLIYSDGTIKPAYVKLKNLIALLTEGIWNVTTKKWQSPNFTPGKLDFTLGGSTENVRHLLLQKSNGEFYWLFWQELKAFDVASGQDVVNEPAVLNVAFNTPILSATRYSLESQAPIATFTNPKTITLAVPDEVVVLKLTPNLNPTVTSDPAVSLFAHDPEAFASQPGDTASFSVYRSGNTANPLTVNYSIDGDAKNGTHYNLVSGSVVIPSGLSVAEVHILPKNLANVGIGKSVIATLANGSYKIGNYHCTGEVKLQTGTSIIDSFESGNTSNWTSETFSTLALTTTNVYSGTGALKWTFESSGGSWNNKIKLKFLYPQDWSSVRRLAIRFSEDEANPIGDMGNLVYFDMENNGATAGNGLGVSSFQLSREPGWRTIELPLGAFERNKVNSIMFYVNGSTFVPGKRVWYIDDIQMRGVIDTPIADFENSNLSSWSAEPKSIITINTASPDSDARDLKWTYNDDGISRWNNKIQWNFSKPFELSRKRKIAFRFSAPSSNPSGDIGKPVYFDIINDGSSSSSGASVARFSIPNNTNYQTVVLDLGDFPRDKMTGIAFYVNGDNFSTGTHVWKIDNVSFY